MSKLKKIFLLLGIGTVVLTGCEKKQVDVIENSEQVVYYEGLAYTGIYDGGRNESGIPHGKGTCVVEDCFDVSFQVKGTWNGGALEGNVELILDDESVIKTKYKDNKASGAAVRSYPDGTSEKYKYTNGIPTGRVISFDSKGVVCGIDSFYKGKRISEWCKEAKTVTYADFFVNPEKYYMESVKISGQVTDILDTKNRTNIIIKNEKNQSFIFSYKNGVATGNKVLVPNLKIGDKIDAYGRFMNCKTLELENVMNSYSILDIKNDKFGVEEYVTKVHENNIPIVKIENTDVYSTLPCVEGIYAEIDSESIPKYKYFDNETAKEYEYSSIARYTYLYTGFKVKETAEVVQMDIDFEKNLINMILRRKSKNNGELYFTSYNMEEGTEFPTVGDVIHFDALIMGNHKLNWDEKKDGFLLKSYIIIPNLEINEKSVIIE